MSRQEKAKSKYRAVNFDLSITLLKQHYPEKNYLKAYSDINAFFKKHNFSHRQWSGYRSNYKMTDIEIVNLMYKMFEELPWIQNCSNRIDVTNVEKVYDIKKMYEENRDILVEVNVVKEHSNKLNRYSIDKR